jgi:hypothetical protein
MVIGRLQEEIGGEPAQAMMHRPMQLRLFPGRRSEANSCLAGVINLIATEEYRVTKTGTRRKICGFRWRAQRFGKPDNVKALPTA